MNPIRIAVIGAGALGRHHARILSGFQGVQLVAVVEPNPVAGQDVAKRCNTQWVADYVDILDQLDAAVVAVPTFAHLDVACDLLERGIPTLVEKPLASNVDQARRIVEAADRTSTLLQVGHVERFNPALSAARPLFGEPKYIRAERMSPYAFRSMDIGVVHDMMIHDLDLVLAVAQSEPVHVEALGVSIMGGLEDCVQARIRFENGCIAELTANRVSPVTQRTMTVWSAEGCVQVDFASREVVQYAPSETMKYGTPVCERARQPGANIEQLKSEVFGSFIKVNRPVVLQRDALTEELLSFVECIHTGKRPLVGGGEALQAMLVADRILQSVATHQWDGHAEGAIGPQAHAGKRRKRAG